MAASYPASIWAGNTRGTNLSDSETHTKWHDDVMAEVKALEAEGGTNPSRGFASIAAWAAALDPQQSVYSAWGSPIAGGITTTTGTTVANYYQVGKLVICQFKFTLGASSAITGDVTLTLPVTAATSAIVNGVGYADDTGTRYSVQVIVPATTVAAIRCINTAGTYAVQTTLSSTIPFTWGTGDILTVGFSYLAA